MPYAKLEYGASRSAIPIHERTRPRHPPGGNWYGCVDLSFPAVDAAGVQYALTPRTAGVDLGTLRLEQRVDCQVRGPVVRRASVWLVRWGCHEAHPRVQKVCDPGAISWNGTRQMPSLGKVALDTCCLQSPLISIGPMSNDQFQESAGHRQRRPPCLNLVAIVVDKPVFNIGFPRRCATPTLLPWPAICEAWEPLRPSRRPICSKRLPSESLTTSDNVSTILPRPRRLPRGVTVFCDAREREFQRISLGREGCS